ncbi:branched-chain amino acid ABC transporter substrate-binding protein [Micromonospora globispora]|uniref:Branched-chain amino acid ABC transporter substrate-binding protein n=1 Tax=Micromonospora globispora TaxID=1450148 RepID=A0A317JW96_9ACTN|nr:ABC transporter substrate-binding protein [Micromonospora globispora]PWU44618.1 branched-chain amino acid ABC transporter substrate-binding protein [Micromonospora globispora]PWU59769.1 branched-chain amino acid ABC transporter substrate-binding protein [Micromonospora globispora]RQW90834.1 branched-chain amino acid ABC transporter substrate-binding protein [Micromonospora globispora]
MLVSRGSRTATALAAAALLLATSACGSDKPEGAATTTQVRLYGSDGNMLNSFATELKDRADLVNGMKGTTPLTPLPESFKERLRTVDPKLTDYLYAAETYDAVVVSALAAQLAGSTDAAAIAKQIVGVTTGGERCDDPAACLQLAAQGRDIEYRGVSLTRAGFTDAGEPATASYATLHFDDQKVDDGKTEFVGAGDESAASSKTPPRGKKQRKSATPLILGGLLPQTGDLAIANPPMAAGAALAVKEVNAAGGVLGKPVVWIDGDDGTNPDVAKATVASHIAKGVQVFIGAGASGISRAVLPDVVAAGRVLFSPSNTDAGLTTVDDKGLYFRTAPSDILQGRALADVILRDGPHKIAIVARKDSYGEGLQENVRADLERAGIGADKVKLLTYEPPADADAAPVDFTAGAKEIKDFGPDAVLIIGFGESAHVITALADAGVQIQH